LHVIAPGEFGGAERVVTALVRGLYGRGHPVTVLVVVDAGKPDNPMRRSFDAVGVPVWCAEVPARGYVRERGYLRDVVRRTGARIVHTHGARADVLDGPVARVLGLKTVSTLHGFSGGGVRTRLYEWLQERAVRRADAVVAVSRTIAERVRQAGVATECLHVIRNARLPVADPMDRSTARRALGIPDDDFVVGWVGRFSPVNGADVLVDSLGALRSLPIRVSLVGDGPERVRLEQRAVRGRVQACIRWHGAVPDAGRFAAAFDVFALSSRSEGTPIALLEAIDADVPVIASAVGGVPDVVGPGEALLVPPDDASALARAIRACYVDRAAARLRAKAAQARVARELSFEDWLNRYEAVYAQVATSVAR
jgi:glycosyltransferase involved in cell wall biosynthesis